MATGDILFLLLFIVLPTAVIVSGVWAIVFVRLRPPATRGTAIEEVETAAEPIALAAPATETTLSLAAVAVEGPSDNAAEHGYADAVAPVLSEREAIANIDPLAADLLFDQPLPPPPAPAPFTDRAPTEEMPAIASDAASFEPSLPEPALDEEAASEETLVAEADPVEPDEQAGAERVAVETAPAGPPVELHVRGGTDDLDPERAGVDELGAEEIRDQAVDTAFDDRPTVTEPGHSAAAEHDISPGEAAAETTATEADDAAEDEDAESPADLQARRRGPLRLIPSDEHDPRDRRRARNAGRRAPQLPRSVRRNERGV